MSFLWKEFEFCSIFMVTTYNNVKKKNNMKISPACFCIILGRVKKYRHSRFRNNNIWNAYTTLISRRGETKNYEMNWYGLNLSQIKHQHKITNEMWDGTKDFEVIKWMNNTIYLFNNCRREEKKLSMHSNKSHPKQFHHHSQANKSHDRYMNLSWILISMEQ